VWIGCPRVGELAFATGRAELPGPQAPWKQVTRELYPLSWSRGRRPTTRAGRAPRHQVSRFATAAPASRIVFITESASRWYFYDEGRAIHRVECTAIMRPGHWHGHPARQQNRPRSRPVIGERSDPSSPARARASIDGRRPLDAVRQQVRELGEAGDAAPQPVGVVGDDDEEHPHPPRPAARG
jgi:hypothetical protein